MRLVRAIRFGVPLFTVLLAGLVAALMLDGLWWLETHLRDWSESIRKEWERG